MNASLRLLALLAGCGGTQAASRVTEPPQNAPGIVVLDAAPADALVLHVEAIRWTCRITDDAGLDTRTLTVPAGRTVKLVITTTERAADVTGIEVSLVGTSATRPVVEGRPSELVFRVERPGTYAWRCPTLLPPGQSDPVASFEALPAAQWSAYLTAEHEKTNPTTPEGKAALGPRLYEKMGCIACHTLDGTPRTGPSWAGIWGTTVTLADGSTRLVDAAYVEASMLEPAAFGRPGFPLSMPSFKGHLKPHERKALIDLIASLPPARSTP